MVILTYFLILTTFAFLYNMIRSCFCVPVYGACSFKKTQNTQHLMVLNKVIINHPTYLPHVEPDEVKQFS